ncbi:FkbM family methyltransferase [Bradyrhizobium erythrophlei]|uniref:FkbM family methyltransferase n=1 Tax=Bradyrhizobium erythrophlei TaxID=1437360 RepID=UPI0035EAD444
MIVKSLLARSDLVETYGFLYVSSLSKPLNIVGLSARGKYGMVSSAPNDLSIFRSYAQSGVWAADLNERLRKFFEGGIGTYLDIGANIGLTVIPIARQCAGVRCFAFEPEPTNYKNLVRNIRENDVVEVVRTHQYALHEVKAVLPFQISDDNLGDHRLHASHDLQDKSGERSRLVIEVPCVRLDDIEVPDARPMFVKIDTQGAEPFVIAGGSATLAKADAIFVEWSPYHMARLKSDPNVVLNFLSAEFRRGELSQADESVALKCEVAPIAEIVDTLRATISAWRDDPSSYLDIVAYK